MEFRTKINKWEKKPIISYDSRIILVGSCFAENLFNYLVNLRYKVFLNPCGISYNPISIVNALHYLSGQQELNPEHISELDGRYFHYDFHGQFASNSKEELIEKVNKRLMVGKEYFPPDILIMSLGTAIVYERKDNGEIVNNCHKMPSGIFNKYKLSPLQVEETLSQAIESLIIRNNQTQIILTVSPVRHIKEGIVENTRSKASLLLAAEILEKKYAQVTYFPSFELLLDDLRDYRFYDSDLVHPSQMAIEYILDFFEHHFMDENERLLRNRVESITKRLNHRPFLPASRQHQDFLNKLLQDIINLESEMKFDFSKERNLVKSQIS